MDSASAPADQERAPAGDQGVDDLARLAALEARDVAVALVLFGPSSDVPPAEVTP